MSRIVSWFSTKKGKIFTRSCVGLTGLSIFGVQVAFHGPAQEKFQKLCQVYENDRPKPLSENVKSLVNKVLQDCNLKDSEKKKLKFFNVIGLDLFHAGGINSPWGGMIGIPFIFEDTKDIDFSKIKLIGHDSIDWIIDGQDLLDAMKLSNTAKKFALIREIYSCDIMNALDNIFLSIVFFAFPGLFILRLNKKANIIERFPLKRRLIFYVFAYGISYCLYRCLKDPLRHLTARKYDRLAASMGPDYLEGGIEFYKKVQMRNKVLRQLLGSRGERLYDREGNENYILIASQLPLRKRIEYLEDMKKELLTVTM